MTTNQYLMFDLASNQLETAIGLFISGSERFSVITLAGAADVILCQLVTRQGKENFTEYSLKNDETKNPETCTKQTYGRNINDTLFINQLKHMDKDDDGFVTFDVDECALAAILKAIVNFNILGGGHKPFIQAFLAWTRKNIDPKKYNILGKDDWTPTT